MPSSAVDIPALHAPRRRSAEKLRDAVHRSGQWSRAGLLERLFTLLFSGLVYPQIWEDPVVDLAALELGPDKRVIAIASGGCNVLSYLTADRSECLRHFRRAARLVETRSRRARRRSAGGRHGYR